MDRSTGILNRSNWYNHVNSRNSISSPIDIQIFRSYNPIKKQIQVLCQFEMLQSLIGNYRFSVVLTEDGIVYPQSGGQGGPNYVHDWLVRAMLNGALGEELSIGDIGPHSIVMESVNSEIPNVNAPSPAIVPDSCKIVVFVYEEGSVLNQNSEIQQGQQISLVQSVYNAFIHSSIQESIAPADSTFQFIAVLKNAGLLNDMYEIELDLDAPAGWSAQFTTKNGTFPAGVLDSVHVNAGDSTNIIVTLNPNNIEGLGTARLEFTSNRQLWGHIDFRLTTNGLDYLIVDADKAEYQQSLTHSFDRLGMNYGIITPKSLISSINQLNHFNSIFWVVGNTIPVFSPDDVIVLEHYIQNGGNLFITGQDIGFDIFEPNGQSQHAQSFYNQYLHATYVASRALSFTMNGASGDIIADSLSFVLDEPYTRSPDVIAPFDSFATKIFSSQVGSLEYITGIRTLSDSNKVIYLSFGFEQIPENSVCDTILSRAIKWFNPNTLSTIAGSENLPTQNILISNYPNPFNPETQIEMVLPYSAQVNLQIFDINGKEVKTLIKDGHYNKGRYLKNWNATNDFGIPVASGVYIYKLIINHKTSLQKIAGKMLLIR